MDFFPIPIEHKNQACFQAPLLNGLSTHLKEKNSSNDNLINQLNQHQVKNLIQKSNYDHQQVGNFNFGNFDNYSNEQQQLNNCNQFIKIKQENDNELINLDQNISTSHDLVNKFRNYEINQNLNQNNQFNSIDNLNYNFNEFNQVNGLNHLKNDFRTIQFYQQQQLQQQQLQQQQQHQQQHQNSQNQTKRGSGRRPLNSKEDKLEPEEEEKRKIRRLRNKEAAARCRKRRFEHTNNLEQETAKLEKEKQNLENEITKLRLNCEQMVLALNNHECKLNKK